MVAVMVLAALLAGTMVASASGVGVPLGVGSLYRQSPEGPVDAGQRPQPNEASRATTGSQSTGNEGTRDAVIASGTPQQREMVGWAVDRFAAIGLQLPEVEIGFPEGGQSECGGAPARTYLDHEPIKVMICWNSQLILLHELAHAWEAHNVDPAQHEPFMAMRWGVESWAEPDDAWAEQGREHAANVIAWGLLQDPYPISRTYPNDAESLKAAFRFLTGTDPLHDGGTVFQPPDRDLFATHNDPLESGA